MSTTVQSLDAASITGVSIGVIVVLVGAGLLLGLLIAKLIARLVIALVVVALAIVVWQQRTHIKDEINARTCNLDATFFGVHLDASEELHQRCGVPS